jgi:glycosyltransferase involved in cell wall biosynthesis
LDARVSEPAVSVIVPCYNGGRFLDELCATLAAQTFRDFETIIVDDGSTEDATLHKLASLEPTIRVLRQQNRRLPGARNTGFREARGKFVLPLDCDDRLHPSFLAETVAILREAPPEVGFVFAHMQLVGAMDGVMARHFNRFDQLFLNQLPYCMLIRRSAWEAAGGYDEAMHDGMEDWEFSIRLLAAGFRGIEIAKPLLIYEVRPDGMLMGHTARMHGTIWRYIREQHGDLYRLPALVAEWRSTRGTPGKIAPLKAAGLLGLAKLLPEAWFNLLFFRLLTATRARRVDRGEYQAAP